MASVNIADYLKATLGEDPAETIRRRLSEQDPEEVLQEFFGQRMPIPRPDPAAAPQPAQPHMTLEQGLDVFESAGGLGELWVVLVPEGGQGLSGKLEVSLRGLVLDGDLGKGDGGSGGFEGRVFAGSNSFFHGVEGCLGELQQFVGQLQFFLGG